MKKQFIITFLTLILGSSNVFAQVDSFKFGSVFRSFIIHLPTGYKATKSYPLVLSFHGLNSNAKQQEGYSSMDNVADTGQFIVVYPNAVNGSWNLSDTGDVKFVNALLDTLENDFSIDSTCVFSTGMSMGGFMTYVLGCRLTSRFAAIAPVAGNMVITTQLTTNPVKGMPVLEIHGTSDAVVSYNGAFGIPTVPETIKLWVGKNKCDTVAIKTSLPDINKTDGCTVDKYTYGNGRDKSEVIHYKINGGGHTWPGAVWVPGLGNVCKDFNASAEIWNFFKKYCQKSSSLQEIPTAQIEVYPNPTNEVLNIITTSFSSPGFLKISNMTGQVIYQDALRGNPATVDLSEFSEGMYILTIYSGASTLTKKLIIRN